MSDSSILDDVDQISALDSNNMLNVVESAPTFMDWCLNTFELDKKTNIASKIKSFIPKHSAGIVIIGMGGSAISGDLINDWFKDRLKIPVLVCREYQLPACVDKTWLGFVLSYSGNTEETLSAYYCAKNRGIKCIGITSGGLLEKFLDKMHDVCLKVPDGFQPRSALLYMFSTLALAMADCNFMDKQPLIDEIRETISLLKDLCQKLKKDIPSSENLAKQYAELLHGTTVIIYGFDYLQAVARRFKEQFNENSKNPAFYDNFPELNHNETVGWEIDHDIAKNYSCIFLRNNGQESEPIKVRIEFTKNLLVAKAKSVIEFEAMGTSRLARMMSLIYTADFTSVYLAFLNGVDPTPVKDIKTLKEELENKVHLIASISSKFENKKAKK
ncbi:MAG TPA: bifunctional phosphoglucose/phosphomannose isomerase [Candidatus Lokiarchaeia archaeon]|nr:bifunctional phosphoglucose/phosphomannose isomerase [Candidatus Lokiarchaeia archaeon]